MLFVYNNCWSGGAQSTIIQAVNPAGEKNDQDASSAVPFSPMLLVAHFPCDCRCSCVVLATDVQHRTHILRGEMVDTGQQSQ